MQQDDPKPTADSPENEEDLEPQVDENTSENNTGDTPENPAEEAPELDPWETLEAEAAKWKDASLRTAAEMDNLRKRTAREREEAIRYANQRLLEELLPILDNFEMGMQAASADTSSMIYIGMDMVRKQLNDFLENQGVEEIPTDGSFDPNLHDAVAQEPADAEEGTILRTTRRGFKIRERLLRPASVIVAASQEPQEDDNTPATSEEA